MVLHVCENVVVDVAEEVHVGLDTPVISGVDDGRVLIEVAAIPATHLVVGLFAHVLNLLLGEDSDRFLVDVFVNPAGDFPMFLRHDLYAISSARYVLHGVC